MRELTLHEVEVVSGADLAEAMAGQIVDIVCEKVIEKVVEILLDRFGGPIIGGLAGGIVGYQAGIYFDVKYSTALGYAGITLGSFTGLFLTDAPGRAKVA